MHTSTCEVENQSEPAVSTESSTRCSVTIYIGKGPGKERIYVSRSAQFSRSVVSDSATPWTAAHQASLSISNSQSLPKLTSIELVMPSNHLIPFSSFQFFPASGSFPISQFFTSGGQSIGVSALASFLPKNTQD